MSKRQPASDILEQCISLVFSDQETVESVLAKHPEYADEIRPELEAALWLRQQRTIAAARPGFVAASSKRLVNQLKQEALQPVPIKAPRFKWNPALLGLALTTLFMFISVLAFRSGVRVIENSLPGDASYSLKITIEDAQLARVSDSAEEAALRIEFTDRRAHEIESLVELDRYDDLEVAFVDYQENLTIVSDLIADLEGDPVRKAELAQDLATTTALNNEMFSTIVSATADLPAELVLAFTDTIALGDETVAVMVVVLDDLGQEWNPPSGVTIKPTATEFIVPTSTDTSTPMPTATNTLVPSQTPVPTSTTVPTATWDPRTPTLTPTPSPTATWDPALPTYTATPVPVRDDGGDDSISPTEKPNPTEEVKPTKEPKPTKTPKDKDK